jgi:ABC-type transport system involved in multi-copper enzyme maturation permease subunit
VDDLKEIGAIWRGETTRALKTGRVLVLLVLFLLFVGLALMGVGLLSSQVVSGAMKVAPGADPEQVRQGLLGAKKQFLATFFTDDERLLDSLAQLPLVLLVVFKLTLRFVPLFIALMGFDQVAGEVGPKSIRYLIVRVKRNSIILGKFLSQATIFTLLLTVCTLAMVLVAKLLTPEFTAGDMTLWTLKLIGSSIVLALAYLSLTALCSALVRQGAVALVLNIIGLFLIWFLALVGEYFRFPGDVASGTIELMRAESYWAYLRYASVWHFGQDLLHPDWKVFLSAAVMHLGFAAAFLGLAQLAMKRRDL